MKRLSVDEETRQLAELREKALKTKLAEIAAARKEGEQIGRDIGMNIGMNKGKLVGKIQILQQLLRRPIASDAELEERPIDDLMALLQILETAFDIPETAISKPISA